MVILLKSIENQALKQGFGQPRLLSNLTSNKIISFLPPFAFARVASSLGERRAQKKRGMYQKKMHKLSQKIPTLFFLSTPLVLYLAFWPNYLFLAGATFVILLLSIRFTLAKAIDYFKFNFSLKTAKLPLLSFFRTFINIKAKKNCLVSGCNKVTTTTTVSNADSCFATRAFIKVSSCSAATRAWAVALPQTTPAKRLFGSSQATKASLPPLRNNNNELASSEIASQQKNDKKQDSVVKKTPLSASQQKSQSGLWQSHSRLSAPITGKVRDNTMFSQKTPQNKNLFCLISIKRTKNNTHTTISNLFGGSKTRWSISAGQLKLPGGRRKTRLSQRLIYKSCLEKAISFGYKFAAIHCKGTRGSKVRIFRSFGSSLGVLLIKDTTGAAHNGCRPRKVRRV